MYLSLMLNNKLSLLSNSLSTCDWSGVYETSADVTVASNCKYTTVTEIISPVVWKQKKIRLLYVKFALYLKIDKNAIKSHRLGWLKFDSQWGHWIFQVTLALQPHYGFEVVSASNRN
jgi:hypothetical protein